MSKFIHKRHNVSVLMYHIVCPTKYRRVIFDGKADKVLKEICLEIEIRYEIFFIEIGIDRNHVHFLVQSVPTYSPTKIAKIIKSITAIKIRERMPEVKKILWGGEFWSKGFYVSTVGRYGDESKISNYVKNQGECKKYEILHRNVCIPKEQLTFVFDS